MIRARAVETLGRIGRLEHVGRVAARLREFTADSVAASYLGSRMADALGRANEKASHDALDRRLALDRPVETAEDLADAVGRAGLRLEIGRDLPVRRLDPRTAVRARTALGWALDAPEIVPDGRAVHVLDRSTALAHWQKRLDGR
jgi:hypothetical protein